MKRRLINYVLLGMAAVSLLQGCAGGGGGSVVYDPYSANYQRAGDVSSYSSWDALNDRGGGSR